MAGKYEAGVKEYRQTYWAPDYVPLDSDILACFKIIPQPGVDREEAAAAVAAESSTGTWTTVWTDLLTDLDYYRGRAYRIEDVPGDDASFYAFVAYPIDLFEEGSVVNVFTSLVGIAFPEHRQLPHIPVISEGPVGLYVLHRRVPALRNDVLDLCADLLCRQWRKIRECLVSAGLLVFLYIGHGDLLTR